MAVDKKGTKQVAANKKAWHDYFVEEKYEAGIELAGTEVKSIRQGHINLKDSYCTFKDGEIFVRGMHISPSRVKLEIGLCKGKKLHDKRDSIAARDAKREIDRAMKERNR